MGIIKQSAVFAEASTSTTLARILSEHIDQIQRGIYQLNVNKLDPSLITYTAAKKVIEIMTKIAAKKPLVSTLRSICSKLNLIS